MVSEYSRSERIREVLDHMDLYIVPVVNVDGYTYTWTKVIAHSHAHKGSLNLP